MTIDEDIEKLKKLPIEELITFNKKFKNLNEWLEASLNRIEDTENALKCITKRIEIICGFWCKMKRIDVKWKDFKNTAICTFLKT